MDDELLDLVNADDEVIGTIYRSEYDRLPTDNSGYFRAAELFIMNAEGKVWTPIRTATKKIAPSGYDFGAAGHVESGDDYLSTIIRESKEEINLDLPPEKLEIVGKDTSEAIKCIRTIYLLRRNEEPSYNPHDFVGAEWLFPHEILERIEAGHPAKTSLPGAVRKLQEYLSN